MRILITESGRYITESADSPEVGKSYYLEDSANKTKAQRSAWHALVSEWYSSGCWSFVDTTDFNYFRDAVKKKYGEGFDRLEYSDNDHNLQRVKTREEIPDEILIDFTENHTGRIKGVLKSFTRYTKKQVKNSIDKIIKAMDANGVDSKKYHEIIKGMQSQ